MNKPVQRTLIGVVVIIVMIFPLYLGYVLADMALFGPSLAHGIPVPLFGQVLVGFVVFVIWILLVIKIIKTTSASLLDGNTSNNSSRKYLRVIIVAVIILLVLLLAGFISSRI